MKKISYNKGIIYCKKNKYDTIGNKILFQQGNEYPYRILENLVMRVSNPTKCSIEVPDGRFFEQLGDYFETVGERRKRKIKNFLTI